ncbi:MAG: ABC transporter permease [Elusimicrobiales bacterium]|nr:ABC transporter permease [Elusimicrobiales bacterium]
MKRYIVKKIIFIPLTFIGISFVIFFAINMLPPSILATSYASTDKELTREEVEEIIKKYNLDKGIFKRYVSWVSKTLSGDLGYSNSAKMNVIDAIKLYLPATCELAIFAIIPIFLIGNFLGLRSAFKRNTFFDKMIQFLSTFFYSMPSFVIGIIILYIFYGIFGIFKPQRYSLDTEILISTGEFVRYSGFMLIDSIINLNPRVFLDSLLHLLGPVSAIFIGTSAVFIKITRSSAIEELGKDYVKMLRAKGLNYDYIVSKHIRKNILIPQITIGGLQFIRLLGGVVITETIFDWPGIGSWGVKSAWQLDIGGLMGFSIVVSAFFIIGNLIIDILYIIVDPRIRYE